MKSSSLMVLACLFSAPVFSQSLPDEINFAPYEARYLSLKKESTRLEVKMNESRKALSGTRTFIREMTDHIVLLQKNIKEHQQEILSLEREIPELEREIQNLRAEDDRVIQDLRYRQNEESRLIGRYNQEQNALRPLEQALARKEQRLRDLEADLNVYRRYERDAGTRLASLQTEASREDRQIQEARNQIRKMQDELRSIDSRIFTLQSQATSLEGEVNGLNANLNTERSKLSSISSNISQYEGEVSRLRASNAPASQIQAAERKLQTARVNRDNVARSVSSIESRIGRTQGQIRTLRSQMDSLNREKATLPSKIQTAESRARQLEMERSRTQNEMNRAGADLQTARRNVQVREQQVMAQRNDVLSDEQSVLRQRQYLESIYRDLQNVQSNIASLNQRSRNLNQEIARASERARANEQRIPALHKEIKVAEGEIIEGERELTKARTDEKAYMELVVKDEANYKDSVVRRDTAESEMTRRLGLYNTYLGEAEIIGSTQAESALISGQKEGERLASVLSAQNGTAIGREMGLLLARHWGSVRGEIDGHAEGLAEGLASTEDIARAASDAYLKASEDAELYAQKNHKPVYFEEHVLEEFKKTFSKSINKMFTELKTNKMSFNTRSNVVPPLTPDEVARSQELVTSLDASILRLVKDIKATEEKVSRLADPAVTFETPAKIPYGVAVCDRVYKGVPVFKASCEGAYKGVFTNNYVNAAKDAFDSSYENQFRRSFEDNTVTEREKSFPVQFSLAHKMARAEGLKTGKAEIYASTYERSYKTSYASEIEKAKVKAKADASGELKTFLKSNPLLTVTSSTLVAEDFRGGSELFVTGKVKNIGEVSLRGPVLVRITSAMNADVVTGEAVLNSANPGITELPSLKLKVHGTARTGEKVIVKGVVDLPGDLYKTSRQESFELVQVLSANPASDLKLEYNKTPDIKGTFRRYIHFATVKIAPQVEDLKEGYELTLTPVGDATSFVDIKDSSETTGPMTAGSYKELRMSYVFKDQAKGKTLTLELAVNYQGKNVRKEFITVRPQ